MTSSGVDSKQIKMNPFSGSWEQTQSGNRAGEYEVWAKISLRGDVLDGQQLHRQVSSAQSAELLLKIELDLQSLMKPKDHEHQEKKKRITKKNKMKKITHKSIPPTKHPLHPPTLHVDSPSTRYYLPSITHPIPCPTLSVSAPWHCVIGDRMWAKKKEKLKY